MFKVYALIAACALYVPFAATLLNQAAQMV
jgi:hypothetical protein